MTSLTVEVDLDRLTLPTTPTMTTTEEVMNDIVNEVETIAEATAPPIPWTTVRSPNNAATLAEPTYGTFFSSDGVEKSPSFNSGRESCPTCGVVGMWQRLDFSHRMCVPVTGPAKPDRLQDVFGSETGHNLHFNMDTMSPAERVATGGNIFRCQTVCSGNCALCMQPCQEQGPSQWRQFTGWDWCCSCCWKDLCWRYHVEYLEPNGYVNTLARFLLFLED